jgi:hypothetical protein
MKKTIHLETATGTPLRLFVTKTGIRAGARRRRPRPRK